MQLEFAGLNQLFLGRGIHLGYDNADTTDGSTFDVFVNVSDATEAVDADLTFRVADLS